MEVFNINTAEVHTDEKDNKYYVIPAGTTIYRGSDSKYSHIVHPNPPPFFGFTLTSVENYGAYKHTYVVKNYLKLLAIMEMDTSSKFYNEAPQNIKNILETNFGYKTKDLRYSPAAYSNQTDKEVMVYLCDKYKSSYDGYAMNGLKNKAEAKTDTIGSGTFHAELAVCGDSLNKVVDKLPLNKDGSPMELKTGVSTGNATRGPVKRPAYGSQNKNNNLGVQNLNDMFGDDTESESDNEVVGGNNRIRFKKRGKQTKRKGKRTKKVAIKYKKTRSKRKRGGGKKKTVSFKSCKSDADCWLSEPECDTKNKICVRKKVFHK